MSGAIWALRVAMAANEVRGHWYANESIMIGGHSPEPSLTSFQVKANLHKKIWISQFEIILQS